MLDANTVNRELNALSGFNYYSLGENKPGVLEANDMLICFVEMDKEWVSLSSPVVYIDSLESEDILNESGESDRFYLENIEHLNYFLSCNAYGGASRGATVCLDAQHQAVSINSHLLNHDLNMPALKEQMLMLLKIVIEMRVHCYPDEVEDSLKLLLSSPTEGAPDMLANYKVRA